MVLKKPEKNPSSPRGKGSILMDYPCLKIYLDKIYNNSSIVNDKCIKEGISVVGVTKCVMGDLRVASEMKKAGIKILGDSRLKNLAKLRQFFGKEQSLMMLRSPMPAEIDRVVEICNVSLNTQLKTLKKIEEVCQKKKKVHNVLVMVETDDDREGLLPENVVNFCREMTDNFKNIRLYGLGTNARCVVENGPSRESLKILLDIKRKVLEATGINVPVISGGNSSIWNMIEKDTVPEGINQLRIGEAILLGHDTINYKPIKGAFTDTFLLEAQIIESKRRNKEVYKILLALGLQDVDSSNIECSNPDLKIKGQSSDHTVLEVKKDAASRYKSDSSRLETGDIVSLKLNYYGLMSCMSSPYIRKEYIKG
ncbi:MAG: alanine racemase [Actinomycetota bacterium]|nr:alanine racemase [Actinomycetota bacterium]